jgi:hypothetical protein
MRLHNWKLDDGFSPTIVYHCSRCNTTAFKERGKYYKSLVTSFVCPEEDEIASRQYLINVDCDLCIVMDVINS